METNRLKFTDLDDSASIGMASPLTGFAVVKAPKGTTKPQYFSAGDYVSILQRLGTPSLTYPGIQEILDFNTKYGIWVSAPEGTVEGSANYLGGRYVTTAGSLETIQGINFDTDGEPQFDKLITVIAGNGSSPFSSGSVKEYGVTPNILAVDNVPKKYFNVDNVVNLYISYPAQNGSGPVLNKLKLNTTTSKITTLTDVIVGDYVNGTGGATMYKLRITGDVSVPTLDFTQSALNTYLGTLTAANISIYWSLDIEDMAIMALYQSSCRNIPGTITVKKVDVEQLIEGETNNSYNTLYFSYKELSHSNESYERSFTISPDPYATDGNGSATFGDTVLENNPFIRCKSFLTSLVPIDGVTWGTPVATVQGLRLISGSTITTEQIETSILTGWDTPLAYTLGSVKVFFDPESIDTVSGKFSTLRNNLFKFSTFIQGVKVSSSDASSAVIALKAKRPSLTSKTGIAYYCNEFLTKLDYSGDLAYTIPVGSMALMLADIIVDRLGGVAPFFTNENSLGGQINKSVKRQKYNFTADQLDELDGVGINPFIYDPIYGLMATSQRTAQSPVNITDWSYLGHQMAFDSIRDEVRTNVMLPQIGKPIDERHMEMRQVTMDAILNLRLQGAKAIWHSGKAYVAEVNTDETKLMKKFVIKLRVKVNPFAETVELVFNNIGATTEV